jgi:hypothetical protein
MSQAEFAKEKLGADHVEDVSHPSLDSLDTIEQTKSGRYSWLVSITAAIGGMLFGYDTGIISAVLVYIHDDLGHSLSSNEKELITSVTSGAACEKASNFTNYVPRTLLTVSKFSEPSLPVPQPIGTDASLPSMPDALSSSSEQSSKPQPSVLPK